jgi:hypothetical protein
VLDGRVQLCAEQDGEASEVEPQQRDYHTADRAVGLLVIGEVADITA